MVFTWQNEIWKRTIWSCKSKLNRQAIWFNVLIALVCFTIKEHLVISKAAKKWQSYLKGRRNSPFTIRKEFFENNCEMMVKDDPNNPSIIKYELENLFSIRIINNQEKNKNKLLNVSKRYWIKEDYCYWIKEDYCSKRKWNVFGHSLSSISHKRY